MKNEKLLQAIGKIDDELIYGAVNDITAKPKRNTWVKWGAMAACFCLIVAAAVAIPNLLSGDVPTPTVSNPLLTDEPALTRDPENTINRTDEPGVDSSDKTAPEFVTDKPREACEFHYNEASAVVDAARRYIPGYFTEELTNEELAAVIPDRQAPDMMFSGYAGFDGEGTLIEVVLQVDAPFLNDANVSVLFSNDEPIRCYVIPNEPVISKLNGHDFDIYQWSPDGKTLYYDAFGKVNECSIRISYVSNSTSADQVKNDFEVIADCFADYNDGKPNLSAIKADAIPEFFDKSLTLSEAQADSDFGAYMLGTVPSGYVAESIRRYKDQNNDYLSGLWTMGYDTLEWQISSYTKRDANRLTGIDEVENYDLSLYPIPRADSVPAELRQIVDNPIFILEELTLDAVYSRAYTAGESGDSNGWRMAFSVKFDDIIVKISSKGVEPEWIYQQLVGLLDKE